MGNGRAGYYETREVGNGIRETRRQMRNRQKRVVESIFSVLKIRSSVKELGERLGGATRFECREGSYADDIGAFEIAGAALCQVDISEVMRRRYFDVVGKNRQGEILLERFAERKDAEKYRDLIVSGDLTGAMRVASSAPKAYKSRHGPCVPFG